MKALVLFSGGIDSTTCLALAVNKFGNDNVVALSVFYGQKHIKEIESAKKITEFYNVKHISIDLGEIFKYSDCCLLKGRSEIFHESYQKQLEKSEGKPVTTYVPFRNGLFLSAAASVAISNDCDFLYYGAHADDACGNAYPDTSIAFNNAIAEAIYLGSGKKVKVIAPFICFSKHDVVKCGLGLNAPYHLTWSCYEGNDKACGVCATCIDRKKAFESNGEVDPIEYEV